MLRWFFGVQVLMMLGVLAVGVGQRSYHGRPVYEWAPYFAIGFSLLLPFSVAYFTAFKTTGNRNYWAFAACLLDSLIALLLLSYIRPRSILNTGLPALYLTINLAGIWLFLQRNPTQNVLLQPHRVTGDRTSRITDGLFNLLFVIGSWQAWELWHRWVGLHSSLNTKFPWDLLVLCFAALLMAAIHECGHALVAAKFGMKLLSFTVGPLSWRRIEGRWRFRLSISILGGAVSLVRILPTPDWQEILMLAAGPAANLVTAPVFFWASLHFRETGHTYLLFFCGCLTVFSALAAILNFFPFKVANYAYSDGAQILQIFTHSPILEYRRAINQLQATLFTCRSHRDLDPALYQRVATRHTGTLIALHAHLCAAEIFQDRGEMELASTEIAEAEDCYNSFSVDLPRPLHTIFIYHHAVYRQDAAAARLWWDRMQKKKVDRKNVDYFLSASALAWIEGRRSDAEESWHLADAEAVKLPNFGAYNLDRRRVARLRTSLDGRAPEPATVSTAVPPELEAIPQATASSDRTPLLVVAAISTALVALVTATPRGSASALLWHCVHGNSMQLAEYNVRVPLFWRSTGTVHPSLIRVGTPDLRTEPRIAIISSDGDHSPKSEQQAMEKMRRSADGIKRFGKNWSASVVVLKTRSANLYCERLNHVRDQNLGDTVGLYCQTALSPSMLSYWGPPAYESEAEDIFSSSR